MTNSDSILMESNKTITLNVRGNQMEVKKQALTSVEESTL